MDVKDLEFGLLLKQAKEKLDKDLEVFDKTGKKSELLSRMEAMTPNYKLVRRG